MNKNFYNDDDTDEKIDELDSYVSKNDNDDMELEDDAGSIKGKISIPQILNKNRMFLVIGIVAVLLIAILALNTGKKKKDAKESYTLGDPDKITVGKGQEESEDNLTPEERAELERIANETAGASGNETNGEMAEVSSVQPNYNTGNINPNYQDDTIYQNTGGFSNIDSSDDRESNSAGTVSPFEDSKEKKKEDGRKSGISFKKNENSDMTQNTIVNEENSIPQIQKENREMVDTDQNKQKSKRAFLSEQGNKIFFSSNYVMPNLSKYELKAGTLIPGVLVTEINSDLPGNIVGFVSTNVYDFHKKRVLVPMGTKILGRYDSELSYGQNRVLIVWERLIFPNGNTLLLDNFQGVDLLGRAGMSGKVNYHGWKLLRSVVLSSLLGATTNGLGRVSVSADNRGNRSVSIGGGAADEANESLTQAVRSMIDRDLNRQPTVKIKQGSRFNIFVTKDMIIPPYKKDK